MKKIFQNTTIIVLILFLIFTTLNVFFQDDILLILSITFGTTFYHFGMRLMVGFIVDKIMDNRADYTRKWFQVGKLETQIYKFIKVKRWKGYMPTYTPDAFSIKNHSWDEIARAMCQAEVVHEIICILSYLPILSACVFGELSVFIITSVLASLYDLLFVIIQRYNRPRIMKMIKRQEW